MRDVNSCGACAGARSHGMAGTGSVDGERATHASSSIRLSSPRAAQLARLRRHMAIGRGGWCVRNERGRSDHMAGRMATSIKEETCEGTSRAGMRSGAGQVRTDRECGHPRARASAEGAGTEEGGAVYGSRPVIRTRAVHCETAGMGHHGRAVSRSRSREGPGTRRAGGFAHSQRRSGQRAPNAHRPSARGPNRCQLTTAAPQETTSSRKHGLPVRQQAQRFRCRENSFNTLRVRVLQLTEQTVRRVRVRAGRQRTGCDARPFAPTPATDRRA